MAEIKLVTPAYLNNHLPQSTAPSYTLFFFLTQEDYEGGNPYLTKVIATDRAYGFLPKPVRRGYGFTEWRLADDNHTLLSSNDMFRGIGEQSAIASWIKLTWLASFNGNGGTGDMDDVEVMVDEEYELPESGFVKTGYLFNGWYKTRPEGIPLEAGSKIVLEDNTTFYAGWKANTYTINFNANSGTGSMSAINATYDVNITLPTSTFTKDGYTFEGWSTSATGAKAYNNGASVKNLAASGSMTLYAVWKEIPGPEVIYGYYLNKNVSLDSSDADLIANCNITNISPALFTASSDTSDYKVVVSNADVASTFEGSFCPPEASTSFVLVKTRCNCYAQIDSGFGNWGGFQGFAEGALSVLDINGTETVMINGLSYTVYAVFNMTGGLTWPIRTKAR